MDIHTVCVWWQSWHSSLPTCRTVARITILAYRIYMDMTLIIFGDAIFAHCIYIKINITNILDDCAASVISSALCIGGGTQAASSHTHTHRADSDR